MRFPEITQFPNRAIVNTHNPAWPALGPTSGLADKFYALKAQLSAARADQRPWSEHRQLQTALLASRWFALGRVLGLVNVVLRAGGKTGEEKITALRQRVAANRWLRVGRLLGIPSARRLLAQAREPALRA